MVGLTNPVKLTLRGVTTSQGAITNLVNLQYLDLSGSPLGNAALLSGLTNLTELLLGNCSITNFSALASPVHLQFLLLSSNPLEDFAPLGGLTSLTSLLLADTGLTNLNVLSGLTKLGTLDLSSNPLGDLAPIAGLTNLTLLVLNEAGLTNVSVVSSLPILQNLDLNHNHLKDLTSLAGLQWPNFFGLSVTDNELTNITTLLSVPRLDYAYLRGNRLDLSPNSSALHEIQILQSRGAFVDYQAELQIPVLIGGGPNGPAVIPGGQVRFGFYTQPGVAYVVEYAEAASSTQWQTLTNIVGDGALATFQDSIRPGAGRFYRLRVP
ncbi:MAG: hypothetical protein HY674_20900 [Chloroflexi bacterium]|nr:hypothetical protein [Chloroflexota bacterium]